MSNLVASRKTSTGKTIMPITVTQLKRLSGLDRKASEAIDRHGFASEAATPAVSRSNEAKRRIFEEYARGFTPQEHEEAAEVIAWDVKRKLRDLVPSYERNMDYVLQGFANLHSRAAEEGKKQRMYSSFKEHDYKFYKKGTGRKNPVELETTGYVSSRDLHEGDEPWTILYEIKDRPQSWGDYEVPVHVIEKATGSDYTGGLVYRSNYEAIQEMVDEDDDLKPFVIYFYGGHGTYGVAIRLDQGDVPDELLEVVGALSDYPLLDEERHSRMEMEAEDEAYDSWGREEWRDALKNEHPDLEDEIDEMSDEKLDELWYSQAGDLSWTAEHSVEGPTFNFEEAAERVDFK